MTTFLVLLMLSVDVVAVFFSLQLIKGNSDYNFAGSPLFVALFLSVTLPLATYTGLKCLPEGEASLGGIFLGIVLIAIFALPLGLPLVYCLANGFANFLTLPGAKNIRVNKTCDQAEKALRQENFTEAERLYRETIGEGKKTAEEMELLTDVYLAYGDFLRQQDRPAEAVEQWALAIRGNLTSLQCITTAARAAEVLAQDLHDLPRAIVMLENCLEKYPKEQETPSLRQRLARYQKKAGG